MITWLIEQLATILLCTFTVVFILPGVLMRLLYTAPRLARVAAHGDIRWSGPILISAEALLWAAFAAATYLGTYFFSHHAFYLATTSVTALICWIVGGGLVIAHLVLYFVVHRHEKEGARHRMRNVIREYVDQGDALVRYASAVTEHEVAEVLAANDISALDRRFLSNKKLHRS